MVKEKNLSRDPKYEKRPKLKTRHEKHGEPRFEPCFVVRITFSNRGLPINSCVINRGFAYYFHFYDWPTQSRVIDCFLKKKSKKSDIKILKHFFAGGATLGHAKKNCFLM